MQSLRGQEEKNSNEQKFFDDMVNFVERFLGDRSRYNRLIVQLKDLVNRLFKTDVGEF